jgi:TPP-dependent indolepyruvate ferredoxin oxidoreductase alpha subunit
METPLVALKQRLSVIRVFANQKGISRVKKEAKIMVPQYEAAIKLLESAVLNTPTSDESNCNTPLVSKSEGIKRKPSVCDGCKHWTGQSCTNIAICWGRSEYEKAN